MNRHTHSIPPIYDDNSHILILGSFPSVKSREAGFYYGHPNNRFWKVLAAVLQKEFPITVESKCELLISNRIALWDVIAECDIHGSADSSIRNAVPNDIAEILEHSHIKAIFTNGKTADNLYRIYLRDMCKIEAIPLPSTSPANASYSLDMLIDRWQIIKDFI